jgi:transketolase
MTELRDAFFYTLLEQAKKDKDVILLTADMGAFALKDFAKQVPNQFFNVGIAEQNMISVAAGLASKGKKVYCYSISSFLVLRAFEQIKVDVCSMNSNVILVGVGAGVDYSYDGSTHHCPNDIGVLNTLPNMSIYTPFDEETIKLSLEESGPAYIRLPKGNVENVQKLKIVKDFYVIREGKRFILTYGMTVHNVLKVLNEVNAPDVGVLALTRLKPMDDITNAGPLSRNPFRPDFMIVEQHSIHGGLLSILGEHKMWSHVHGQWHGYRDKFVDVGGSIGYIEKKAGLDYEWMKKQIMGMQNGK